MTTAKPWATSSKKIVLYFTFEFSMEQFTHAKCVMPGLDSKLKYEKSAAAVHVHRDRQNLVI